MTDNGHVFRPRVVEFHRRRIDPGDVKVFEPGRQQTTPVSACVNNNGGCSHLCLASERATAGFSCACATGKRAY